MTTDWSAHMIYSGSVENVLKHKYIRSSALYNSSHFHFFMDQDLGLRYWAAATTLQEMNWIDLFHYLLSGLEPLSI